jgi:hypothetical protein
MGWFAQNGLFGVQLGVILHFVESAILKNLPLGFAPKITVALLINGEICRSDEMLTVPPNESTPGAYPRCNTCPQQLACTNENITLDARAKVFFPANTSGVGRDRIIFTVRDGVLEGNS